MVVKAPAQTAVDPAVAQAMEVAYTAFEREALDHVWIHSANYVELAEKRGLKVFDRGDRIYLYDIHGNQYIDGISGLWVVNAGHGRKEIADAIGKQAAKLAYVSSGSYTNVPATQLGEILAEITPGDLERVFLVSGGSEAVESAMKIAKQVQFMRGFPSRHKVIARRGSYHGATFGAMSLTTAYRVNVKYFGAMMDGVYHTPSPNRYRNDFGLEGEAGDIMCAKWVEKEIEFQGPETVAAVIGEPISTANGCHVPSPKYWQMLREICDKHGVLLICDEVINGFGRTGKMFATEHFGITPDIMTMAKGLSSGYQPIAAAIVRPSVYDVFKKGDSLSHLITFGGHAVAAAAAIANLEIFKREDLPARGAEMGAYLLAGLKKIVDTHPTAGDARGQGLMCVLEFVKDKNTKEKWGRDSDFIKRMNALVAERKFLSRVWDVMHFAPPLVITKEEIDNILNIVDESLTICEREFGLA